MFAGIVREMTEGADDDPGDPRDAEGGFVIGNVVNTIVNIGVRDEGDNECVGW